MCKHDCSIFIKLPRATKSETKADTYHNVPSTSNTIPFNGGAFDSLANSGFNGANLRWRSGYPGTEDITRGKENSSRLEDPNIDL